MPGVRRRTTRPREVASRKHEEKLRAANTAGNEGRSERVSYGVRFGAAQDRIEHTGRGEEVVRSAAENDAAAGDL